MNLNSKRTVLVLANAIEVVAGALHELSGNGGLSQAVAGNRTTRAGLADMVAQRINARFVGQLSRPTK